jgi:CRISPR/Cas system-associated exonuclease Cas4 (RecB family)
MPTPFPEIGRLPKSITPQYRPIRRFGTQPEICLAEVAVMSGGAKDQAGASPAETTAGDSGSLIDSLVDAVSADAFDTWWRERKHARNIRKGTPYFNGPASIKPPRQHSPSSLFQCHRKVTYKQLNAPEESGDPAGIFWIGSKFETDVAVPFLQDEVAGDDEYVTNSIWVDFTVETDEGELRIKGETDPVVVDANAKPLLLTEIKTKRSVESVESPSGHHKAQAHAYLKGLSEKYERSITDAIILYGSRTTLDVRAFHIKFDPVFWSDMVVEWAAEHSGYRLREVLPPDDPEFDWECDFCSFSERCGRGKSGYADVAERGFLPGIEEYPRGKVAEYLEAVDEAQLTPTLANEYPQLAIDHQVCPWQCPECDSTFAWETVDTESSTPACPVCADKGKLTELVVENPVESCSASDEEVRLVRGGE